jgi:hypothetical protein
MSFVIGHWSFASGSRSIRPNLNDDEKGVVAIQAKDKGK